MSPPPSDPARVGRTERGDLTRRRAEKNEIFEKVSKFPVHTSR